MAALANNKKQSWRGKKKPKFWIEDEDNFTSVWPKKKNRRYMVIGIHDFIRDFIEF